MTLWPDLPDYVYCCKERHTQIMKKNCIITHESTCRKCNSRVLQHHVKWLCNCYFLLCFPIFYEFDHAELNREWANWMLDWRIISGLCKLMSSFLPVIYINKGKKICILIYLLLHQCIFQIITWFLTVITSWDIHKSLSEILQ